MNFSPGNNLMFKKTGDSGVEFDLSFNTDIFMCITFCASRPIVTSDIDDEVIFQVVTNDAF